MTTILFGLGCAFLGFCVCALLLALLPDLMDWWHNRNEPPRYPPLRRHHD